MNIQDMQYITAIAEAGSIGRAANKLLVAQPSLSKCIQKVEREYGITLFKRVKGVSVKLTPEGELFLGMAREMLLSHARFQEQLRRLKEVQNNSLVLGLTYQRTVDLAGAILERFYLENPQQIIQIQTRDTHGLQDGILDKSIDAAVLSVTERREELYYEPILRSCFGVYLRSGSLVAKKAIRLDNIDYPVLRLEDLAGERFAVNTPGSASRTIAEELLRKNGINIELIGVTNNQSRIAMVTSGIASAFVPISVKKENRTANGADLYMIHPDQNVFYQTCLVCLKGFQDTREFKMICTVLKELIKQSS